jgi:nitrate reductase cytochrome c-type subunit
MGKHILVNMRKTLAILLIVLFAVSMTAAAVSAAVSKAEKTEIQNAHKNYRAEVGANPLIKNDKVAASALSVKRSSGPVPLKIKNCYKYCMRHFRTSDDYWGSANFCEYTCYGSL